MSTVIKEEPTGDFVDPLIEAQTPEDPFSPENIGVLQFIMLSRIYDILMVDFTGRSPEAANQLLEAHKAGVIVGPVPQMTGEFRASSNP